MIASGSLTVLDALVESLCGAAGYNRNDEVAPVAVLWPDPTAEWECLIPRLPEHLRVISLGSYEPDGSCGPAAWIRCAVSRAQGDTSAPDALPEAPLVVYLPGWTVMRLQTVHTYDSSVQPLAELQFRSSLWLQPDDREWTISAFLQRKDCGLGIAVQEGAAAHRAMRAALPDLASEHIADLHANAPLKLRDFEAMGAVISGNSDDDLRTLIAGGETDFVEFKATGRVPTGQKGMSKEIEGEVIRAIGGFLNAQGGALLIGVEDDGTISGLTEDFAVTRTRRPDEDIRDAYIRYFMDRLDSSYGKRFLACLSLRMLSLDGKDICRIDVRPAPWPAWLAGNSKTMDDAVFYLRVSNSTRTLPPIDLVQYVRERWP